jgi:hypothetical protein
MRSGFAGASKGKRDLYTQIKGRKVSVGQGLNLQKDYIVDGIQ